MDEVLEAMQALPPPTGQVSGHITAMGRYHRARMIQAFRAALAVDISPFITEAPVRVLLNQQVTENVRLIRTIQPRFHAGLTRRLQAELQAAPFDQARLRGLLSRQYKSSGYDLRRLTRDQTNKTIGRLTQIRQQQLGIQSYEWLTAEDERVRPTHDANSGLTFQWSDPPDATGHPGEDIQRFPGCSVYCADRSEGCDSRIATSANSSR